MKPSDLVLGAKVATPEENEQLLELSGEQPVVDTPGRPSDLFMNRLPNPVIEDLAPDVSGVAQQIQAESMRESDLGKGTVQGAYMKNLLGGSVEEFDELKPAPLMSEEDKKGFMFTLDRLWRAAKNPYDIVKGTAEFVSAIPGFVAGLGTGMVNIPLEVGRRIAKDEPFTIEDLYNAAAGPFSEVMNLWHQGVSGPLGKLLDAPRIGGEALAKKLFGTQAGDAQRGDPELVGEIFMAPYTAVSGPLHMLADSDTYKDFPNCRGVIKFAADALGLITMGRVIKGGKEEFVAKAEPIIHKATEIDKAQKDLSQVPDSVFKDAQQKILDVQKKQLELEAKAVEESLDYPKMIKEDLQAKRKTIDQIKKKDVTKDVDEAIDTGIKKATEQSIIERHFGKKEEILKEAEKRRKKVRKKIERTEEVSAGEIVKPEPKKPSDLVGERVEQPKPSLTLESISNYYQQQGYSKKDARDLATFDLDAQLPEMFTAHTGKEVTPKNYGEMLEYWKRAAEELEAPKEIDYQLGERKPVELEQENHPLREADAELVNARAKVFDEKIKGVMDDPELFTGKLVNDVNRWLNGDESVPIEQVRSGLRELAVRADELRYDFFAGAEDYPSNFINWKELVTEASEWAGKSDRLKIKRTESSIQLNMMIPLDEIPGIVKDWFKRAKKLIKDTIYVDEAVGFIEGKNAYALKRKDVYRNKELWEETGFWLDKEGYWRYELGPEDVDIYIGTKLRDIYNMFGKTVGRSLPVIVKSDKLYAALPKLKDATIVFNKTLTSAGRYNPYTNKLMIKYLGDISLIRHELTHAVEKAANTGMIGTSPITIRANRYMTFFDNIISRAKSTEVRDYARRLKQKIVPEYRYKPDQIYNYVDSLQAYAHRRSIDDYHLTVDILRELFPDSYIEAYMKDKGEMLARLASYRDNMSASERAEIPPWESLDRMLYYEGVGREHGTTLFDITQIPAEAGKLIKNMTKEAIKAVREFRRTEDLKKFDLGYAAKQLKIDTVRGLIDQSEPLLKQVRKLYPKEAQKIIDRQRSVVAGKGYGRIQYDLLDKEIYGGRSKAQVEAINMYVFARRFNDIYGYKAGSKYKHVPAYGPDQMSNLSAIIEMAKDLPDGVWKAAKSSMPEVKEIFGKLTSKEISEVIDSGNRYFEWMRKVIDDVVEAGLKTPEEGELLKAHDFRKFKTLKVEQLYDFNYNIKLRGETIRSTYSGVEPLGRGSLKIIDTDPRPVTSEMFARIYGAIANQAAKKEWKALAEKHPENGIVKISKPVEKRKGYYKIGYTDTKGINRKIFVSDKIEQFKNFANKTLDTEQSAIFNEFIKNDKGHKHTKLIGRSGAPVGWVRMPYMENGKDVGLYFNPTATKYLITQSHDLSHRLTKVIRGFMLAPVTRSLAVATSPAWATFVGLPMDVGHSIFTAKIFDPATGKSKKLYSPFLPHATMQIGLDLARTLPDVYTRGEFFKDYMKHGGVMPFLTMRENRYMRGVRPPGDWAKFIDLVSYHGASMETWVRAATADRAIRRVAKREGISYEEARRNKDVMYEAVHAARDRMDYNQGGWFVKALDQLGFIFLNAGMLGARTFWRSVKENPVDFTLKAAQIGVTAAGIATVNWMLYPHVMKDIPEEGNEKNLIIPLFPDHISAIDKNGDEVYFYAKLRLDPGAAFMYKVFDGLTRTYLHDQGLIDQEPDYRKLVGNLKTIGPYGLSLPPTAQMASEYWSNYSWWKDRRMYTDMGGRTLDWPKSRKEGIYDEEGIARDPRLSQLSVDVSKVTGLSPVRGQEAIGNVIPRNNEFVMMMSGAYEWAFSDVPKELKSQHWLLTLADMPVVNRIIGVTRPGYNIRSAGDEPTEEARLESIVRNGKMDFLAENYYWKGYGSEQEIDKYIDSFENEPHVVDTLENKRKFVEGVKDISNRSAWVSMFHTTPEAKAKHFFKLYGPMSSESNKILDDLMDAKYLSSDGYIRFMDEMDKLSNKKVR